MLDSHAVISGSCIDEPDAITIVSSCVVDECDSVFSICGCNIIYQYNRTIQIYVDGIIDRMDPKMIGYNSDAIP